MKGRGSGGSAHCRQHTPPPRPAPLPGVLPLPTWLRAACCQHLPVTAWRGSRRLRAPWDVCKCWAVHGVQSQVRLVGKYCGLGGGGHRWDNWENALSHPPESPVALRGNLLPNHLQWFLSLLVSPPPLLLVLPGSSVVNCLFRNVSQDLLLGEPNGGTQT